VVGGDSRPRDDWIQYSHSGFVVSQSTWDCQTSSISLNDLCRRNFFSHSHKILCVQFELKFASSLNIDTRMTLRIRYMGDNIWLI
jgi:hypothetical protein